MNIPKDLADLPVSGYIVIDEVVQTEHCVSGLLLRDRFAFSSEIKLTREEALKTLKIMRLAAGWCNDVSQSNEITHLANLIQSKLAASGEENE